MSYLRFAAMIATSTLAMFGLMYLNSYALEHLFWSETRAYMAFVMGATMAIIMLGYMLGMYRNTKVNIAIFAGSAIVFSLALWLVRSQATVSGESYMRAMIPHHSIAILTSKRAQITDPRVRKLAEEIVEAQEREIAEMRYLIAELPGNIDPEIYKGKPAEVASLDEALSSPEIATLDAAPMQPAEFNKVLPAAPGCSFSLTATGPPVLVARATAGQGVAAEAVTKLSGTLVPLQSETATGFEGLLRGPTLHADGIRMVVKPVPDEEPEAINGVRRWKADLRLELEQGLRVGYRGFYFCDPG
ncbi:DUF305 domain-containing protein [Thiohalomonas denitrificans]|uniref:DUF305 domain-containing protein n=1 Tax=Thiohalomonas denitrificans TaxID=415747 RepID=A0A1G5QCA8_9GAMM|nr:DUF305 domain-containing protein [Thiohalomonas denitrificans]SCZ59268.1 protein of unknown function [Thiohalomonas denitrificans]